MNDPKSCLVSRDDEVVISAEVSVPTASIDEVTCVKAAQSGNVEVLKFMRKNGLTWDEEICAAVAAGGHLEALKYAHENGCRWDETTCNNAAEGGHIEVLRYARANGCRWGSWKISWAAEKGYHEVREFFMEELERRHQAIPGLLNEIVINYVLKSDHIPDKSDLARLRAVSPAMRDAVYATRRLEQCGNASDACGRWFRDVDLNKFVDKDGEVLEGRAAWRASEKEKETVHGVWSSPVLEQHQ